MVNTAEIGLIYLQAFSDGDFVGIEYFWERYCGWIIFYSKFYSIIDKLHTLGKKIQSSYGSFDLIYFYAMSRLYKGMII